MLIGYSILYSVNLYFFASGHHQTFEVVACLLKSPPSRRVNSGLQLPDPRPQSLSEVDASQVLRPAEMPR